MMKRESRGRWTIATAVATTTAAVALAASCAEPTAFTPQAPTVPVLRLPRNDVYEGSVLTGSLRPTFVWETSTAPSAPIRYELQYSSDRMFASDDTTTVPVDEPRYQPEANLPVSMTPPVGRRYFWRVRACVLESCSEYSPTWWVNLGRSAKDFNGDGYADVAVGSSGYQDRGAAFIYFGGPGPTLNTIADAILDNSLRYDSFSHVVASAGDFNGDGFGDVAVASYKQAFLYFGGAGETFDQAPDVVFPALQSPSAIQTIAAGDLNADGFSDLLIGDPNNNAMGLGAGRISVYFGGTSGSLDIPDGYLNGRSQYQAFGYHASVADIDGDGFADVVASSNSFDDDTKPTCFADVFFGQPGSSFETLRTKRLPANTTDHCTSHTVVAGDLDGDGFNDLVMGINNSVAADQIEIFRGRKSLSDKADAEMDGRAEGFTFLNGLMPAGDVNGDGLADIIVLDGSESPKSNIYLGLPAALGGGVAAPRAGTIPSGRPAAAGDVNGDGYDDIIVGDSFQYKAFINFGGPGGSFDSTPDWTLTGVHNFGTSVARLAAPVSQTKRFALR